MSAPVTTVERQRRDAEWDALPLWRRGEVIPAAITLWLDFRGLYGPEIDTACGVREPAVDEWESGDRYPDWPELVALARLVDVPITAFFQPVPETGAIFLCDRSRPGNSRLLVNDREQVDCYSPAIWQPIVEHWSTLW